MHSAGSLVWILPGVVPRGVGGTRVSPSVTSTLLCTRVPHRDDRTALEPNRPHPVVEAIGARARGAMTLRSAKVPRGGEAPPLTGDLGHSEIG